MPLLPPFLLLTHGAAQIRVAVPIENQRPSRILRMMSGLEVEGVFAVANDETSTLVLTGPQEGVEEFRTRLRLFDVAARKSRIGVEIISAINHARWKGQIEGHQNLPWEGTDGATGVKLTISPRANEDGTCTLFMKSK